MEKLNYKERLNRLGLMRLGGRRGRSDSIEAFKVINCYYGVTLDLFFTFNVAGRRGHSKKLFKKKQIGYKETCFFK